MTLKEPFHDEICHGFNEYEKQKLTMLLSKPMNSFEKCVKKNANKSKTEIIKTECSNLTNRSSKTFRQKKNQNGNANVLMFGLEMQCCHYLTSTLLIQFCLINVVARLILEN